MRVIDALPARTRWIARTLLLLAVLYLFFASIEAMGAAFKLLGKNFAETLLSTTGNPLIGVFIGLLATAIVQSSSLTTSIVVGMVAGGALTVEHAIPIVMGANIGTTITNTAVSLGHLARRREFKKAFAAATVHDFFNLLTVAVLLPVEIFTGYLRHAASGLETLFEGIGGLKLVSPLKIIVEPAVSGLVRALEGWLGAGSRPVPLVLLGVALPLLFVCLLAIVHIVRGGISQRIENLMNEVLFQTSFRAFALGLVLTAVVQSSSVTTSLVVPLAGAGLLTVEQLYPYAVGANIGTTVTAVMASLVTQNPAAVTVAFAHTLFNVSGTLLFLVVPSARVPIRLARGLAEIAYRRRWAALLYIGVVFFLVPLLAVLASRIF